MDLACTYCLDPPELFHVLVLHSLQLAGWLGQTTGVITAATGQVLNQSSGCASVQDPVPVEVPEVRVHW